MTLPVAAFDSVHETLRASGTEPGAGSPGFLQARTANEVLKAQERKLGPQRLKGELIDRARATAQVFTLARHMALRCGLAWVHEGFDRHGYPVEYRSSHAIKSLTWNADRHAGHE